jgi:hypothetical protein
VKEKQLSKEKRQPARKSKLRNLFLNFGKLVLDATKLCFGSLVLGAAIKGTIPEAKLMFIGIIVSAVGAVGGLLIVTFTEEK